jgi:hypothetical protein
LSKVFLERSHSNLVVAHDRAQFENGEVALLLRGAERVCSTREDVGLFLPLKSRRQSPGWLTAVAIIPEASQQLRENDSLLRRWLSPPEIYYGVLTRCKR